MTQRPIRRTINAVAETSDDDRELLARWRDGDSRAGSRLFDRHFRALHRFFRNKVDVGVEDLIQETMVAVVRGRDRIRDDGSFRAYLFGTAKLVLYAHIRSRAPHREIDVEHESLADLSPGVSTAYAKHREQQILLQALRMLPMEFQVTLELYYWEGMSGPELAAALDIPEATVRSRLRRGSEKLREHVERLGTSPELVASTMSDIGQWLAQLHLAAPS